MLRGLKEGRCPSGRLCARNVEGAHIAVCLKVFFEILSVVEHGTARFLVGEPHASGAVGSYHRVGFHSARLSREIRVGLTVPCDSELFSC